MTFPFITGNSTTNLKPVSLDSSVGEAYMIVIANLVKGYQSKLVLSLSYKKEGTLTFLKHCGWTCRVPC